MVDNNLQNKLLLTVKSHSRLFKCLYVPVLLVCRNRSIAQWQSWLTQRSWSRGWNQRDNQMGKSQWTARPPEWPESETDQYEVTLKLSDYYHYSLMKLFVKHFPVIIYCFSCCKLNKTLPFQRVCHIFSGLRVKLKSSCDAGRLHSPERYPERNLEAQEFITMVQMSLSACF